MLKGNSKGDPDDMLSLDEALEELHMDRSTFYRMCKNGYLTKVRHANKIYVKRQWIWDYWTKVNAAAEAKRNQKERARRAREGGKKKPHPEAA